MRTFQNYHRHSCYTNPKIADSVRRNEDYAKRAQELGHGIISVMEHGYQGRYIEGYELAEKYGLKFVFGTEAYWVKDRLEPDRTNCHMCIFARNENGRQAINDILSEANLTGIYYQARLDLGLILSLNKEDVIITTACIAGWRYEDMDEIVVQLHNHFRDSFYLEVQYHNTESQKALNARISKLSKELGIQLIMGCDSHYITADTAWERDDYIKSKGIDYPDEENWILDYPDGDTAYQRFVEQGILSEEQINSAMDNTNVFLAVEEYDNPCFQKEIKMPTLYPELSQKEKDKIFIDLIEEKWEIDKKNVPEEKWDLYHDEIKKELKTIVNTKFADYFLIDYWMIKNGIEKGGVITPSSRGSGASSYVNKLLGLTKVDRISADVKMYFERFMSETRIIETKGIPDIDLNLANVTPFAEAQKELLGEEHSYPMLSYGTMQPKAAWKMYAKSQNVDFETANAVSEQIFQYEMALKHVNSEDEKEDIIIDDYIEDKYKDIFESSKSYLGVISDYKISPCSYLLYQGNIRKEIGLIQIKKHLCCLMDGKWAEEYKFLKNDLLKVSVVDVIDKVFKKIGKPIFEINELLSSCPPNDIVWDVYKNGWTMGINQFEQNNAKGKSTKYKPKNISEVCAFVAAIRPGFKSMYKTFENREDFSYGIETLDNLIRTPQFPQSFILYQEIQMAVLNYSGIPMTECYDIIKNIAKKRVEKVLKYQKIFRKGFTHIITTQEGKTEEEAKVLTDKVWKILEDSASYMFNASHAYCTALDSLYGAYLKSHHPVEFYTVFLQMLEEGSEKDRMAITRMEAVDAYNVYFPPMKFRQDNREICGYPEKNQIVNSLQSIKGFSKGIAENLYNIKDIKFNDFVDLLVYLEENGIMSTKIKDLISIQYFSEFGKNKKLTEIYELFRKSPNKHTRGLKDKTKEIRIANLKKIFSEIPNQNFSLTEQIKLDVELTGYIQSTYKVDKRYAYVQEVNTKYAPRTNLYCLANGKISSIKIKRNVFSKQKLNVGDVIYCEKFVLEPSKKLTDEGWVSDGTNTWWLDKYHITSPKIIE